MQPAEPNPTQGETDPGSYLIDSPDKRGQHFLVLGPALRILQLNVEDLSAAKRELISDTAVRQKADVVCLQETHVNDDKADCLNKKGSDIVNYALHSKHGWATYVRSDITEAAHVVSNKHCDVVRVGGFHIVNVYKPPSEMWGCPTPFPVLPHPTVLVGDFNSHHPDWGYPEPDSDGDQLQNWASCNDFHLIHDSKQRGTFRSARWNCDYSPDLCWISTVGGHPQPTSCTVLDYFPHSQHRRL
jgi:Endonuclease-reverse transcriptase